MVRVASSVRKKSNRHVIFDILHIEHELRIRIDSRSFACVCSFCSADGNDTGRPGAVRRGGQHDKPDVCDPLQLGAACFYLLVLQRRGDELRQSPGRRVRDNREGQRRHDLLASHTSGPALGLRGVQMQAEQREHVVHQGACSQR